MAALRRRPRKAKPPQPPKEPDWANAPLDANGFRTAGPGVRAASSLLLQSRPDGRHESPGGGGNSPSSP